MVCGKQRDARGLPLTYRRGRWGLFGSQALAKQLPYLNSQVAGSPLVPTCMYLG